MTEQGTTDDRAAAIEAEAESILTSFLSSIPIVRIRALDYGQSLCRPVDLDIIMAAAHDSGALGGDVMLTLVKTAIEKIITRSTMTAEEAWADHSIGMAWDSDEHQYGEYRQFLSGFEYRDGLSA